MTFYYFVRFLARVVFRIAYPPKLTGREHVPAEGPYILVCNHRRLVDPVVLGTFFKPKLIFLAKSELSRVPLLTPCIRWYGAIFINRHSADMAAIRAALSHLQKGGVLGIFPEGTRNKTQNIIPLEEGVGLIALRSRAPVLPVYLGPYRLFRRQRIAIGSLVELDDLYSPRTGSAEIASATRRIQEALELASRLAAGRAANE